MTTTFERPVFARVRRLCLRLPETTEVSAWGHPNFRVGRKTFCALEIVRDQPTVAFHVTPAEGALLLQREDCFATPYGRGRWVSMRVDGRIDWTLVERLVQHSYRTVAGKRLLAALDAAPARRE